MAPRLSFPSRRVICGAFAVVVSLAIGTLIDALASGPARQAAELAQRQGAGATVRPAG